MTRVSLSEFTADLKSRVEPLTVRADPTRNTFRQDSQVDPAYVWPDIRRVDGDESSPMTLVSAPGAMGKSAAAKALAHAIEAPYVDLSTMHVGSGTLTGEIAKAFDFVGAAAFVTALKEGRSALVLDGTDEAQLAAGRENYLAFVADLAWLLSDAVPAGQVLIFGRRDATESTQLALLDLGYSPPRYEIAPLTHDQAVELIDQTLDLRVSPGGVPFEVHRKHAEPFAQLREALFEDIGSALGASGEGDDRWAEAEDFLGYPPVVLAFAEWLAVDNPAAELASMRGASHTVSRARRGELLRGVVERVMDRETVKVKERLGDGLALHPDDTHRNALYGFDEQVSRLLALTGTEAVALDVPAWLDPDDRATYENQIADFVADHPFVAGRRFSNVVFSDYVRAWAISSPIGELYAPLRRAEFLSTLPAAGPFFAHFLHALGGEDNHVLPEHLVADAISSFHLGAIDGRAVYVQQDNDPNAALILGEEGTDESATLQFDVTELTGVLELRSPIVRTTVVTDAGLLLRGNPDSLTIGPGVALIAAEVEIDAKSISVLGATSDTGANTWNVISARTVSHPNDLKLSVYPHESALAASWPDMWHQWKPFKLEVGAHSRPIPHRLAAQIVLGVRRVVAAFRPSMEAGLSVSADKVDRVVVGSNRVFSVVLGAMMELKMITRHGGLYTLSLERLGEYGVSWAGITGDDPGHALRQVIDDVIRHESMQEFLNENASDES